MVSEPCHRDLALHAADHDEWNSLFDDAIDAIWGLLFLPCRRDQATSVETAQRRWWGLTGAPTGTRPLSTLYLARLRWRDNRCQLALSRTRYTRSPSTEHITHCHSHSTSWSRRNLTNRRLRLFRMSLLVLLWLSYCPTFQQQFNSVILSLESIHWTNSRTC